MSNSKSYESNFEELLGAVERKKYLIEKYIMYSIVHENLVDSLKKVTFL